VLTDYFIPFVHLEKSTTSDGLGGVSTLWTEGVTFQGNITAVCGSAKKDPARHLKVTPTLVHEYDVTLTPGDIVRRVHDGALFRVMAASSDFRTPEVAATLYAQVPVERLVNDSWM